MTANDSAEAVQDPDDWDRHWDSFGGLAETTPASIYRRELIMRLLGNVRPGATLLDIGSGQGEITVEVKQRFPELDVWGVEYSAVGIRRAQANAKQLGVDVDFVQRDLMHPVERAEGQALAAYAVCSEVLEHVEDPAALLRNAATMLLPGAKVVVTVPGGPRSAFDKHIGHRTHFSAELLTSVLTDAGLDVDRVLRAGFPGFNLYKLAVVLRGKKLIDEAEQRQHGTAPSKVEAAANRVFTGAFKLNRDNNRMGWQMAAVAHVPAAEA